MQIGTGYSERLGCYFVEAYVQLKDETLPKWYTLRLFRSPGEATLFYEYVTKHTSEVYAYVKTYNEKFVVQRVYLRGNDKPTLRGERR